MALTDSLKGHAKMTAATDKLEGKRLIHKVMWTGIVTAAHTITLKGKLGDTTVVDLFTCRGIANGIVEVKVLAGLYITDLEIHQISSGQVYVQYS